ncbi:MAG TPA: hypothetical protein VH985_17690, partial [Candidatus Binatia bacterium]
MKKLGDIARGGKFSFAATAFGAKPSFRRLPIIRQGGWSWFVSFPLNRNVPARSCRIRINCTKTIRRGIWHTGCTCPLSKESERKTSRMKLSFVSLLLEGKTLSPEARDA